MKNEMKDEDLEKVSGGWTISESSSGDISIQFLTRPQVEALSNLSEELSLDCYFTSDTICDYRPRIKINGRWVLKDPGAPWDPACGRCNIRAGGFNGEIFARIKQVLGEPDETRLYSEF